MNAEVVRVNLGPRSYDIAVVCGDAPGLGSFARQRAAGRRAFLVTDENVRAFAEGAARSLAAADFRTATAVLPAGETHKSLGTAGQLYDRLADLPADRQTVVAAVGGGVVGDVAGFVAATFARGLPLLMVPTTLLAMVDSSVGGKTGVNHPRGKNLIGAFHQPIGVWIDTAVLATLPDREYRSGLAEVVKYGVILDPDLFAYLEMNAAAILQREGPVVRTVIHRCCRLKADVVEQDEREESGRRSILNYGHTFAHAFETVGGYGVWLHGEAVAAGMMCAARLAEARGLLASGIADRQKKLLDLFGLPTAPGGWSADDLLAVMRQDKKSASDRLRFVLPRRLGEVALFDDVTESEIRKVLNHG
jgi:3-dehydroquinate synthase